MPTWISTTAAMTAFAANSVLCRLALGAGRIDAASFMSLRVLSAALLLFWLVRRRADARPLPATDWRAVGALLLYLPCFSFSYLSLTAGTGALILFGTAQLTMFAAAFRAGERFAPVSWVGLAAAVAGMVWLLSPGLTAPPLAGAALMTAAGVGWGLYSLRGRAAADALAATSRNMLLAAPCVVLCNLALWPQVTVTPAGAAAALLSGSVATGLGYVIWYRALPRLRASSAATVQLSVPVIAALAGVALLGETATPRLVLASALVLGGIGVALRRPRVAIAEA